MVSKEKMEVSNLLQKLSDSISEREGYSEIHADNDNYINGVKKAIPEIEKAFNNLKSHFGYSINSEEINPFENVVEIGEMVAGYWQVIINDLPIANYRDKAEAEQLANHFVAINKTKNIKRI